MSQSATSLVAHTVFENYENSAKFNNFEIPLNICSRHVCNNHNHFMFTVSQHSRSYSWPIHTVRRPGSAGNLHTNIFVQITLKKPGYRSHFDALLLFDQCAHVLLIEVLLGTLTTMLVRTCRRVLECVMCTRMNDAKELAAHFNLKILKWVRATHAQHVAEARARRP